MVHLILVVTSGILAGYSPIKYIHEMLTKERKPHRTTRLALCIVLVLSFFSTRAANGNPIAQIQAGIYAVSAVIILGMCLRKDKGIGGTSKADMICLAIALAGTAGWLFSGDVRVGVACSIGADIAAYIPTVISTWKVPGNEGHWSYTLSAIAAGLSLAAYPFTTGSWFPAYLVFIDGVMVVCIKRPQIQQALQKLRLKRA